MADLIAVLLVAVIAAQLPIGVVVYLDARRLGLENPERYWLAIIVPMGGLLVFLVYLSRRDRLPRAADASDADGSVDAETIEERPISRGVSDPARSTHALSRNRGRSVRPQK